MLLRLDQSVQELSAISSQSCQASDCHCRKMLHRLDQICELQWQSEERQIWLPMAGGSCTGWSNLRSIVPIYEVYRYSLVPKEYMILGRTKALKSLTYFQLQEDGNDSNGKLSKEPVLKGVMRVGVLSKGLLLR